MDPTTLSSLKVTELKAELKKRGLPVGGLKQALVDRLAEDILKEQKKESEAEEEAEEEEEEEQVNGVEEAAVEVPAEPEVQEEESITVQIQEPEPTRVEEAPVVEQEHQTPDAVEEQLPIATESLASEEQEETLEEVQQVPVRETGLLRKVKEVEAPVEAEEMQIDATPEEVPVEVPIEDAPTVPEQVVEEAPVVHEPVIEAAPAAIETIVEDAPAAPEQIVEDAPAPAPEQIVEDTPKSSEPIVEDAHIAVPDQATDEDAPMTEAPVEAPEEAPVEAPTESLVEPQSEAPIEPPASPAEISSIPPPATTKPFLTATEDEITVALTSQTDFAPSALSEPMDTREDTPTDLRKRKRRSVSPPPAEPLPPADESESGSISKKPRPSSPTPRPRQRDARFKGLFNNGDIAPEDHPADPADHPPADDDDEPPVPASIHPATCALYIRNLVRPINEPLLKSHLATLAGPVDGEAISFFFVDAIKSHALMVFSSVAAATRVRVGVHGKVWPNERTRKPLWADFVPEERVQEWVERERKRGAGGRWEVVYMEGDDGMVAELEEVGAGGARKRVEVVGAPTGPRGRGAVAAVAERVERKNSVLAVQKAAPETKRVVDLDELFRSTRAKPKLYWMPVSEEIARERLAARGRDERGRH